MHPQYTLRIAQRVSGVIYRRSPSPRSTNNLLFFTLAGTAAAGGAYYFMRKAPPENLSARAKRDEEDMAQKARESLDATKSRGDVARKQTQQKYEEFKANMEDGAQDAQSRVKELSSDAKARYESYKDSASDALSKTRGSVEKVYDNTKAATDEKLAEVRSELGDQSQKIQQGWFSWLGWGKSNVQRRENRPESVQRASGAASAGKRAEKNA
ncbi:hypothetical protein APHAL10511_000152 [Amanita phalloides]|nr:hypothetical protein APHAL10511_000152 [Amanita phalloides]